MNYLETWQAIEAYLTGLFAAEMAVGGRLAAFRSFSSIVPPEGEPVDLDFPILALEYDGTNETWESTRSKLQTSTFSIAGYVLTSVDPQNPISDPVRRTKAALKNLWNDQNGNGLGPVLRSDPTLADLALSASPTQLRMVTGRRASEGAGSDGILLCTFTTLAELQTQ